VDAIELLPANNNIPGFSVPHINENGWNATIARPGNLSPIRATAMCFDNSPPHIPQPIG